MFVSSIAEAFHCCLQQVQTVCAYGKHTWSPPDQFWFFQCMSQEVMNSCSIIIALISKDLLIFKIVISKLFSCVRHIYNIWNKLILKHSVNLKEHVSFICSVCQHNLILTFHQNIIYKLLWDCSCLNKNLLH